MFFLAIPDFFCQYWWLPWILLPLLGLLLGWLIWGRYKNLLAEAEDKLAACQKKNRQFEVDLAECRKAYASTEGENATLRGRMREMEAAMAASEAKLATGTALTSETGTTKSSGKKTDIYASLKSDNLQVVEGVGPKMEEVLKNNKVTDWSTLASQSPESLRALLDKSGTRYQIIDPATWPEQAALANAGKWDELITLQKALDTGRATSVGETDSKVEKLLIKMGLLKKYKKDDLKAIEGIGPKIEKLLHEADIKTWKALANAEVSKLQKILDKAGDRYNLADPTTWPKQAKLAHKEKWEELQEYQDFLQGGKEK